MNTCVYHYIVGHISCIKLERDHIRMHEMVSYFIDGLSLLSNGLSSLLVSGGINACQNDILQVSVHTALMHSHYLLEYLILHMTHILLVLAMPTFLCLPHPPPSVSQHDEGRDSPLFLKAHQLFVKEVQLLPQHQCSRTLHSVPDQLFLWL